MNLKLVQRISIYLIISILTLFSSSKARAISEFVKIQGTNFTLNNSTFNYAGTNNYYLIYKSKQMVEQVFDSAQKMNMKVIRTWAFLDRGSLNGAVNNIDGSGEKDGVYFQYWDTRTGKPAYNDGVTGLQHLDFVIYAAQKRGIKLILPLVNNWREFGGMDQYLTWYGLNYHDDFYTNSRPRQAYKDWVTHLLNHKNIYTGIVYKNDPTIMAWELANEPRCKGSGNKSTSSNCNTVTLVKWVQEMSAFIKKIDAKHLVTVGDEGFFKRAGGEWLYNGSEGGDFEAFLKLPTIDFGTFHLYPNNWGKSADWGNQWIQDHISASTKIRKPVILEEFGWHDQNTRNQVYQNWTNTICRQGGAGDNVWMLAAKQDNGTVYPDYDGFTIYYPSAIASLLKNHANMMATQCRHQTSIIHSTSKPKPIFSKVPKSKPMTTKPLLRLPSH